MVSGGRWMISRDDHVLMQDLPGRLCLGLELVLEGESTLRQYEEDHRAK